jgi:hypothetical protein
VYYAVANAINPIPLPLVKVGFPLQKVGLNMTAASFITLTKSPIGGIYGLNVQPSSSETGSHTVSLVLYDTESYKSTKYSTIIEVKELSDLPSDIASGIIANLPDENTLKNKIES